MKQITIRISNAAPAWPHELTVDNITYPFGSMDRLMWKFQEEYTEDTLVKFERITCRVSFIHQG